MDGRYGPLTAAAVERFQANHSLRVNGTVGRRTWHALRAAPVLALGAGDASVHGSPAVAHLQRLLRHAGFHPGAVDGRFGRRTEHAILAFQRARRLTATGIAGSVTERALTVVRHVAHHSVATRARRRSQPPRSVRARHLLRPQPIPGSHSVPVAAPVSPRPPLTWILIGLGLTGVACVTASYLQTRRRVTGARSGWHSGPGIASGGRPR